MGRGGRGGGGRSSGGGSSHRSSGGRMSSSGRAGGSFSRSSRSGFGGSRDGGFGGYRPPRRPFRPSPWHYAGRGRTYAPPVRHTNGCAVSAAVIFIVLVAVVVLFTSVSGRLFGSLFQNDITRSTVKREPLAAGAVIATEYYTDELGWIRSGTNLTKGMKVFFEKTGVQPYLYLTDTVDGAHRPSSEQMDSYAKSLYDTLFEDEGHLLLLFHEYDPGEYSTWYVCGAQAKTVMDQEACDILLDYIDHYYYSDYEDDEMFSLSFEKAADRIMKVTRSPWPIILIAVCVVVVVIVAFLWWKKAKAQKNREAEQTERILNADLNTMADEELEDLEKKYSDGEESTTVKAGDGEEEK